MAWPQHWWPWWVRPSLGDTPVWPALHRVGMPAQQEMTLRRITHGSLWHPGHCCTLWQLEKGCAPSLLLLHTQDLRAPLSAPLSVAVERGMEKGIPALQWGEAAGIGLGCCAADKSSPQKAAEPLAGHFGRVWCWWCEK